MQISIYLVPQFSGSRTHGTRWAKVKKRTKTIPGIDRCAVERRRDDAVKTTFLLLPYCTTRPLTNFTSYFFSFFFNAAENTLLRRCRKKMMFLKKYFSNLAHLVLCNPTLAKKKKIIFNTPLPRGVMLVLRYTIVYTSPRAVRTMERCHDGTCIFR